jgi:hypothetical protein
VRCGITCILVYVRRIVYRVDCTSSHPPLRLCLLVS